MDYKYKYLKYKKKYLELKGGKLIKMKTNINKTNIKQKLISKSLNLDYLFTSDVNIQQIFNYLETQEKPVDLSKYLNFDSYRPDDRIVKSHIVMFLDFVKIAIIANILSYNQDKNTMEYRYAFEVPKPSTVLKS